MILLKRSCKLFAVSLALLFLFTGCMIAGKSEVLIQPDLSIPIVFNSAKAEREAIFSLGAYVVVYKNWQTKISDPKRGHNIGSILVNKDNIPVAWARNSIAKYNDGTQHGEVRVIQQYIDEADIEVLDGYIIYTTLEPCIMCSGMMSMVKVKDTVYGQTDGDTLRTGYGRAIERIKLDSSSLKNGYKPYPRAPETSKFSELPHAVALDYDYANSGITSITEFLLTDSAQKIYKDANEEFYNFKVKYDENQVIYDNTRKLLDTVN